MENRIEVRCCCEPGKLLGTLPIPVGVVEPRIGQSFGYVVQPERIEFHGSHEFTAAPFVLGEPMPTQTRAEFPRPEIRVTPAEVLRLEVTRWEQWLVVTRRGGLALKSDDTPIETLRRIPGFVEAQR